MLPLHLLLLVSSVVAIYFTKIREEIEEFPLKEVSTKWRDLAAKWQKSPVFKQSELEEAEKPLDETTYVPLIHYVRLFGCCLVMAQFSFILHLSIRIFLPDYIQEDSATDENIMQLVDMPKLIAATRKRSKKDSRKTTKTKKKEPSIKDQATSMKKPTKTLVPDELVTAIDKSDNKEKKKLAKTGSVKPKRKKSQRLPRAEKGHQTELLNEMDAFLLGEEAAAIEEKVRGQDETKRSEQGPPQLRVEEIGTAHDEENKKSPDIRKSDDI